jgi:hypothetical protein
MNMFYVSMLVILAGCGGSANRPPPSNAIDFPASAQMHSVSGMSVVLDASNEVTMLCYGEREAHGGVRLSPVLFGKTDLAGKLTLTDDSDVILKIYPTPAALHCYKGTIQCDRKKRRVEIALEVKDENDWKPFGWNGDWPLVVQ